ncbi:class I SAM-dependent methyltransferase [Moraxella canis]|uniref:class I SAM-dependent methyltransferase n=1 Tax=Moraxella canis TaxID=90239 RepID=UPI0006659F9E|nr:class I SAM-dependent methyltransferase [Moraxella canis]
MRLSLLYDKPNTVIDKLLFICQAHDLPLDLDVHQQDKLNDKQILRFKQTGDAPIIAILKNTPMLIKAEDKTVIKSALNWAALQHRIVTAGRKSELILQACKLQAGMTVLDGTAGFGHDALILASSGAQVTLCESNPVMALLLYYEYHTMAQVANWQGLLGRMDIIYNNTSEMTGEFDCVYLDPMFPKDSYKAKVNKQMQALHDLAAPPTQSEAHQLFCQSMDMLKPSGKLIIKRPIGAPYFDQQSPDHSIQNEALRFDRYDKNRHSA